MSAGQADREAAILDVLAAGPLTQAELRTRLVGRPDGGRLFGGRYPSAVKSLVYTTSMRLIAQGRLARTVGHDGDVYGLVS